MAASVDNSLPYLSTVRSGQYITTRIIMSNFMGSLQPAKICGIFQGQGC